MGFVGFHRDDADFRLDIEKVGDCRKFDSSTFNFRGFEGCLCNIGFLPPTKQRGKADG